MSSSTPHPAPLATDTQPSLDEGPYYRPIKIYCSKNGIIRFGQTVEHGFLTAFSVESDEEALDLIKATCGRNLDGEFISGRVADRQDLDALEDLTNFMSAYYHAGGAS